MKKRDLFYVVCSLGIVAGVVFFSGVLSCFGQCPGGVCAVPSQGVEINLDAVMRVKAPMGRDLAYGSGSVVQWGDRVVFLTAWHVVKDGRDQVTVLHDRKWHSVELLYADTVYDFAVYTPPACDVEPLPFGVPEKFVPGMPVSICGFGGDGRKCRVLAFLRGRAKPGRQDTGPDDWISMNGAAISGDSGGPVITQSGFVIGVLWGARSEDNTSMATQSGRIAAAIESLDCGVSEFKFESDLENEAGYEKCRYTESTGFCRPCQPPPVVRSSGSAGSRIPVQEPQIITRPYQPPSRTPEMLTPPPAPSINVTCPPCQGEQPVTAAWVDGLSAKVDVFDMRINNTEAMVAEAVGSANTIVTTVNGRLTTLETQALLDADEKKQLPSTIATIAGQVSKGHTDAVATQLRGETAALGNQIRGETATLGNQIRGETATLVQEARSEAAALYRAEQESMPGRIAAGADVVVKGYFPLFAACAAAISLLLLLCRRWLDKLDGKADGYVDRDGLKKELAAWLTSNKSPN